MASQIISLENQKWSVGAKLAEGEFADVHDAQSADGTPAVVKLIPKSPGAGRELLFDEDLDGVPNVVPVLDRGELPNHWVIAMPRADKSLNQYWHENIEHLSLDDTVQVLHDVIQALVALESRGVVHRDIKPENVLLLGGRWCLADFGIARYAEATTAPDTRKYAMTPSHAAPEQWRAQQATNATDVYASGVVAYQLLAGRVPFEGPEIHDFRRQHLQDHPAPIRRIPPNLQSLINECLYKNPQARPVPQNLLERLTNLKGSVQQPSAAVGRLQEANAVTVRKRAETARKRSIARSEKERRDDLYDAASQSLAEVLSLLDDRLIMNAPSITCHESLSNWLRSLGGAELSVEPNIGVSLPGTKDRFKSPFEIVSYSSIDVTIVTGNTWYSGRSHSLWYCDAKTRGSFRWYETAFMTGVFTARRDRAYPYALKPSQEAYVALLPIIGHDHQVAWPFTPIDQGDEDGFIERWIGWFAEAALGELKPPRHMPERPVKGTWRQQ